MRHSHLWTPVVLVIKRKFSDQGGISFLLLYLMTLMVAFAGLSSQVNAQATITLNLPQMIPHGGPFCFEIHTTEVANLDTLFLKLEFDADIFEYQGFDLTDTLMAGTSPTVNNTIAGRLLVIMSLPGVKGVNGSGRLAKISFKAIGAAGQSGRITLTEIQLGNIHAVSIPTQINEPTATIAIKTAVPAHVSAFPPHPNAKGDRSRTLRASGHQLLTTWGKMKSYLSQ